MRFNWHMRKTFMGIDVITSEHSTFTSAVDGMRSLIVGGVYVAHSGDRACATFKPKWADFKRLVLIEQYDDAEEKLKLMVQQFRQFFKKHGRRITTVKQEYVFPQDMYADGVSLMGDNAVPDKVRVSLELE